jgi:P2-related tail formation protein
MVDPRFGPSLAKAGNADQWRSDWVSSEQRIKTIIFVYSGRDPPSAFW